MKYSLSFRIKSYFIYFFNLIIGTGNIKMLIRVIAAYRIYKRENAGRYKSEDAKNIIWFYYPNFKTFKDCVAWDILMMAYVAATKQNYKVHRGADIGIYKGKNILFNTHKDKINFFGVENYSSFYLLVTEQLEVQNNNVYPTHHDVLYWENKLYMYEKFKELNVRCPRTIFYTDFSTLKKEETTFPFLIKIPHSSGSYGLFNVTDANVLTTITNDPIIIANKHYIVQERLNITMDMRVILVDGKIVHFYWRKNNDKSKWKTTSTSAGSSVDFETFPEQWRQYIIDSFNRLGLITGAFDVGWQNDDTTTEPYFFEVSPSYDINPKTTNPKHLNSYGKYKKQLLLKDSYDRLFVEQTFDIKSQAVAIFLNKHK